MLFSKTKIYTVHIDPSQERSAEKAVFIREGFSLFAFLFGTIWALYNRLWLVAIIVTAVLIALTTADHKDWLSGQTVMILNFAFTLIIGLSANDLRRAALGRKGYITSDVVVSDSELLAQQRYFDRVLTA